MGLTAGEIGITSGNGKEWEQSLAKSGIGNMNLNEYLETEWSGMIKDIPAHPSRCIVSHMYGIYLFIHYADKQHRNCSTHTRRPITEAIAERI